MAVTALRSHHIPGRTAEIKARLRQAGIWLRAQPATGFEEQAMRLIGLAAIHVAH